MDDARMSDADRAALVETLKGWEGEEVALNLRFISSMQIAPNTFGNGPTTVQGRLLKINPNNVILQGTGYNGATQVMMEQTVLISDILFGSKVGSVMRSAGIVPGR